MLHTFFVFTSGGASRNLLSTRMKRYILTICILCFSYVLFAQGYRVGFKLNDEGKFYIPDSERNYYVFEYGDAMDSEELKAFFYSKWEELHRIPSYFDPTFKDSNFDMQTGIIKGTTPEYDAIGGNVHFNYSFKIQFRDGRIRIDPPSVSVVQRDTKINNPQRWINSAYRASIMEERTNLLDAGSNGIINEFLAYVEAEDNSDKSWRKTCELGDRDAQYIALSEDASFKFVNAKDSTFGVFEINGYSKEQLKDMYWRSMVLVDKTYFNNYFFPTFPGYHTIDQYTEAISFDGNPKVMTTLPVIFNSLERCYYSYEGLVEFQNNYIKVYVPKIKKVQYDIGDHIHTPEEFSYFFHHFFIGKDGHFKEKGLKGIEDINRAFNIALFHPIYLINRAIEEANAPKEEW